MQFIEIFFICWLDAFCLICPISSEYSEPIPGQQRALECKQLQKIKSFKCFLIELLSWLPFILSSNVEETTNWC